MKDDEKTKEQLISDLAELRQQVAELNVSATGRKRAEGGRTRTISRDITERKQTEQELIRLERLRALGEMSAGISHNLNNILVGVLGPAQLLQRDADDPELLQNVEAIILSARRARDLVQRLYQAVRGKEEGPLYPVLFNSSVQQSVKAAEPRWKDEPESRGISIKVVTDLEDVSPIRGTQSGLHDILINLLFNAVDAMPEGGTIVITTEAAEEGVRLTVRDTGIGMDEETRKRIFEPFFTTKMDVGTGLGLSTIYGTVRRWGGSIEVESSPGKGTTFTFRFPVWTEPEVQEEEKVEVRHGRR